MTIKLNEKEQKAYKHFESVMNKVMKYIDSSMDKILPELLKTFAEDLITESYNNDKKAKEKLNMLIEDGFNLWCCKKGQLLIEKQETIRQLSEAIKNDEKN
tara:strand:+ start:150 stop:452 length:303 start_codon:yes stop_codon:yes gene_type:complete